MGGRRRKPYRPPGGFGDSSLAFLRAVDAGAVVRDEEGGAHKGMWACYVLDGTDVGMAVRSLAAHGLIFAPLIGPPLLTADGAELLRTADRSLTRFSGHDRCGDHAAVAAWL